MMYTHEYMNDNYLVDRMNSPFNPMDYIEPLDDGFALCTNPVADGGMSAITVNTNLSGEARHNFESSIKRMVLSKLFSPKFGEVILAATSLHLEAKLQA